MTLEGRPNQSSSMSVTASSVIQLQRISLDTIIELGGPSLAVQAKGRSEAVLMQHKVRSGFITPLYLVSCLLWCLHFLLFLGSLQTGLHHFQQFDQNIEDAARLHHTSTWQLQLLQTGKGKNIGRCSRKELINWFHPPYTQAGATEPLQHSAPNSAQMVCTKECRNVWQKLLV